MDKSGPDCCMWHYFYIICSWQEMSCKPNPPKVKYFFFILGFCILLSSPLQTCMYNWLLCRFMPCETILTRMHDLIYRHQYAGGHIIVVASDKLLEVSFSFHTSKCPISPVMYMRTTWTEPLYVHVCNCTNIHVCPVALFHIFVQSLFQKDYSGYWTKS